MRAVEDTSRLRLATEADRAEALADYVRVVADRIGLRDWEIHFDPSPATVGRVAEVDVTAFRQEMNVRVCLGFGDLDQETRRHAVVHEMVHGHAAGIDFTACQVRSWMPERTWETWHSLFERDLEVFVDAMAVLLCPLVPLPQPD